MYTYIDLPELRGEKEVTPDRISVIAVVAAIRVSRASTSGV